MRFGLFYLFSEFGDVPQDRIFREVLDEIDYGEQLGFDSVWLPEHHFSVYGTLGNPLTFASAVAQRTRRMLIGTAVMVLPFQHPLRLAEDAALVDALSGGRLLLGVGRGYQVPEFDVFDVAQDASRAMFMESLDIIKLAFTEEGFSYDGKFWKVRNATVFPKPVQKPHPPIYWAGISPATYEQAGRLGYSVLRGPNFTSISTVEQAFAIYTDSLGRHGHDVSKMDLPFSLKVYVAPTDDEARAEIHHALWFYHTLAKLLPGAPGRPTPAGYEHYPRDPSFLGNLTADQLWNAGVDLGSGTVFGSPERVIEQLRFYMSRTRINHWMLWFKVGGLEHGKVLRSMELFTKHVMPALREAEVHV
jgi:alkanesulfonate monooxygenase SsuD/methylene tetrahydromethanopterin reductase-like flavin-dependent oxidoreductase (luciferase family)